MQHLRGAHLSATANIIYILTRCMLQIEVHPWKPKPLKSVPSCTKRSTFAEIEIVILGGVKGAIITKLLARYDDTCQLIHENSDYWFVINDRKRRFPELSHTTENVRITQDLHDRLNEAKIHPDETINTVLQRLLFSYYVNKLVYRINIKTINNKDSQDLIFFMRNLLLAEPKFNNALFVEVVSVENYPEIKNKYDKNTLPLSILYDFEELEVWRMEENTI